MAGRKEPQKVQQGQLNKLSGMPDGNVQDIEIAVGQVMIPNYSLVWGKRVLPSNTAPKGGGKVSITDPAYRGEIKFLSWGEEGGEGIEVRHLSSSSTLDKQYQEQILKLKPNDEEGFIFLNQGLNDFEPATDSTMIQMLKIHSRNADSKSRNPDILEYDFIEYNPEKRYNKAKDESFILNTALNLVFGVEGNDDNVKVLAIIMGLDEKKQTAVLLEQLLESAKTNTVEFVNKYQNFKAEVNVKLNDAVEAGILDISQDSVLSTYIDGRKEVLLENIEASYKGKNMLRYVTDNILELHVFEAADKVVQALKKQLETV